MKTTITITPKTNLFDLNTRGYRYVVMLRDHYKGNSKGEYFAAENYDKIRATMPYWFKDVERPVHTIILTNDDVPTLIARRYKTVQALQAIEQRISDAVRPRKNFDGRKTAKTAPKEFAAWRNQLAAYNSFMAQLNAKRAELRTMLDETSYSSTLHEIR